VGVFNLDEAHAANTVANALLDLGRIPGRDPGKTRDAVAVLLDAAYRKLAAGMSGEDFLKKSQLLLPEVTVPVTSTPDRCVT
jgi:hypothetical protein